jgi:hypothetical protein
MSEPLKEKVSRCARRRHPSGKISFSLPRGTSSCDGRMGGEPIGVNLHGPESVSVLFAVKLEGEGMTRKGN